MMSLWNRAASIAGLQSPENWSWGGKYKKRVKNRAETYRGKPELQSMRLSGLSFLSKKIFFYIFLCILAELCREHMKFDFFCCNIDIVVGIAGTAIKMRCVRNEKKNRRIIKRTEENKVTG